LPGDCPRAPSCIAESFRGTLHADASSDPAAALAKWLENKRLREERLAQRRQYGAIRLNPVLVSNVEVHAPEPSEAERDAHSVRGSGSFDLGLPALVGVGVGGGGMGQHGLSAAPPPYLKGANPEPNPTPAQGSESRHLESRPTAAARLALEESAGWVIPSSRGLCGGDARLPSAGAAGNPMPRCNTLSPHPRAGGARKQRFSGRPRPQPDPLPTRTAAVSARRVAAADNLTHGLSSLAAAAVQRRYEASRCKGIGPDSTVLQGPLRLESELKLKPPESPLNHCDVSRRRESHAAAPPRHLQPMANAPEPLHAHPNPLQALPHSQVLLPPPRSGCGSGR
jgi:hypothetical protein